MTCCTEPHVRVECYFYAAPRPSERGKRIQSVRRIENCQRDSGKIDEVRALEHDARRRAQSREPQTRRRLATPVLKGAFATGLRSPID